ncbi:MAG TPA: YbhB/YbcL family Raf kinase inhibitor-like protein, partial [Polyangiaceae bacterium]|nr:YbhB/YbcL family Raf kinase inhibitor-like protein [Polyangiaceae bacterium]
AGTGGGSGTTSTAAGTGGTTSGSAGMASTAAGTGGSGGSTATGGSGGATTNAGQGGSGGSTGGQGGHAGSTAGASGRGTTGGAGTSAGGQGRGGMSGASGSAGSGTSGTGAGGAAAGGRSAGGNGGTGGIGSMTLTSSVIMEGGMFPDQNTCASTADDSPDLTWTAGPNGTMSYAVVLFDTSNMMTHWVIWDIPPSVTALPAKLDDMAMPAMPAGAKQKSFQGNGYAGPCPSGKDHVYRFTVYALPVAMLSGVTTSSQPAQIGTAITNANPLASASLSAHSLASQAN